MLNIQKFSLIVQLKVLFSSVLFLNIVLKIFFYLSSSAYQHPVVKSTIGHVFVYEIAKKLGLLDKIFLERRFPLIIYN